MYEMPKTCVRPQPKPSQRRQRPREERPFGLEASELLKEWSNSDRPVDATFVLGDEEGVKVTITNRHILLESGLVILDRGFDGKFLSIELPASRNEGNFGVVREKNGRYAVAILTPETTVVFRLTQVNAAACGTVPTSCAATHAKRGE